MPIIILPIIKFRIKYALKFKNLSSRMGLPEFRPWLCHVLAVLRYFTLLYINFLIQNVRDTVVPDPSCRGEVNELKL